jgi:hypothetical protein
MKPLLFLIVLSLSSTGKPLANDEDGTSYLRGSNIQLQFDAPPFVLDEVRKDPSSPPCLTSFELESWDDLRVLNALEDGILELSESCSTATEAI